MKSYSEFTKTVTEAAVKKSPEEQAASVEVDAKAATQTLEQEIGKLLPSFYKVMVRYSSSLGKSITVRVYDTRKESVSVTWMNSSNSVHLMMHLTDSFGRAHKAITKVSWESLGGMRLPEGVKFRKINAVSIEAATKKLLVWFKKHQKAFTDAPANPKEKNFFR